MTHALGCQCSQERGELLKGASLVPLLEGQRSRTGFQKEGDLLGVFGTSAKVWREGVKLECY